MDVMSLTEICQILSSSIGDQEDLLENLKLLCDQCDQIESFQQEYDYSVNNPGSGYRSLVKAVRKYFHKLHDVVEKKDFNQHLMNDYSTTAKTLAKCLKLALLVRGKGVDFDSSQITELDYEFYTEFFDTEPEDVQPLMGQVSLFQLKAGVDVLVKRILFLLNLSKASIWDAMKMMFSSSFASLTLARTAVCMNLRMATSLTPTGCSMIAVRTINSMDQRDTKIHRLKLVSRNEWLITVKDPSTPAILQKVANRTATTSSLLIIPNNMDKDNKKVILHAHGGAFIAMNAQMASGIMARTAKSAGVPVLAADYRKIPEHKYPAALQDVFDVYTLLTSGDENIEKSLGFRPEQVILTGDSAGSHIVLGIVQVLNRLRKNERVKIRMPKSIAIQYPCVLPSFVASSSFSMMLIDPMLSTGFVGLVAGILPPLHPEVTDDQWYRKRDGTVRQTISRISDRVKDPLFNLLAYKDYEDLKDIPLFILACEMDPLIDHSVMMAKKWHGPVRLDIVPDVCHGYVAFHLYSGFKKEIEVYYNQINEAVNCDSTTNNNNNISKEDRREQRP